MILQTNQHIYNEYLPLSYWDILKQSVHFVFCGISCDPFLWAEKKKQHRCIIRSNQLNPLEMLLNVSLYI